MHRTFLYAGETEFSLGEHPSTACEIKVLLGPYGWYLEMAPPAPESKQQQLEDTPGSSGASKAKKGGKAKAPKPQRVSLGKLPAGQVPEVTLEEAVELLQWPKVFSLCSCTWLCTSLKLLRLSEPTHSLPEHGRKQASGCIQRQLSIDPEATDLSTCASTVIFDGNCFVSCPRSTPCMTCLLMDL